VKRPIELLVLAGGFGTRLRSVVAEVPKPMAPVAGNPFLYYLIESWIGQGVTKLTFLLHHQAKLIEEFLNIPQTRCQLGAVEVRTVVEARPLGTGGSVAHAVEKFKLTESFLVANADTWLGAGIRQLSDPRPPAIAVVKVENSERYGSVETQSGRIIRFEEKQKSVGAGEINAGLYRLHAKLFHEWNGEPFSLESQLLPKLANAGQLEAIRLETDFIDIGIPEDYFRFCRWVESGKAGSL